MKYLVLNVAHGLGPIIRLLELGEELNRQLAERGTDKYSFIIPDLGERQNLAVADEFRHSDIIHHILVDPIYGRSLTKIAYKGDDHRDFLCNIVSIQPKAQEEIAKHFKKEFTVHGFSENKERRIRPSDCYEIARNPFVRLPFPGFMYTFGYRSDIIKEMQKEGVQGYDEKTMEQLLSILETAEEGREINFVQDPPTIKPSAARSFTYTPLHARRKLSNNEQIEQGVYVSVTGIKGLREKLIADAERMKLRLYSSVSVSKDFPEAVVKSPDIVTNPNIKCVFARFGWGAITLALMSEKPLITPQTDFRDDPEIFLNKRLLVDDLKLASVLDNRHVEEVLEEASERAKGISKFLSQLQAKYKTVEGPAYASRILADYLTR